MAHGSDTTLSADPGANVGILHALVPDIKAFLGAPTPILGGAAPVDIAGGW